jgi:hypothetical protein
MATDKNHHYAKFLAPVSAQHEIPRKFSAHLQLGISALHPKYRLLQAMFAETHLLQKFCKHSETRFSAEHSDLTIATGIVAAAFPFPLQKQYTYCELVYSLVRIVINICAQHAHTS